MARKQDRTAQADVHNNRGIELAERGWLDEATNEFRKAIALDPRCSHAHDNLGTILAEKGELLEALQQYTLAVSIDPGNASTHHYLASFLLAYGAELSIGAFRKAITIADADEVDSLEAQESRLYLAIALADQGHLEQALEQLQTAHAKAPAEEHIQHELACVLIELERYPEAITHLKQITKACPEHLEAFIDLGIAYTAQGFYTEAEQALQRVLQQDAHNLSANYQLAVLYVSWHKHDDAYAHLQQAAQHDPDKLRSWLKDDPFFAEVLKQPKFQAFVTP